MHISSIYFIENDKMSFKINSNNELGCVTKKVKTLLQNINDKIFLFD